MNERKSSTCTNPNPRNVNCDQTKTVDRIYLALSHEEVEVEGKVKIQQVEVPVIKIVACYGEDPDPEAEITTRYGREKALSERIYVGEFRAESILDRNGEEVGEGECEILVGHQHLITSSVSSAIGQLSINQRNVDTLSKFSKAACLGAAGMMFTVMGGPTAAAAMGLVVTGLQTSIFCGGNIANLDYQQGVLDEQQAHIILNRYLTLAQRALVRKLKASYETVHNANDEELDQLSLKTTKEADLFILWARANEKVRKKIRSESKLNLTPLTEEEKVDLVRGLYQRVVASFNSDLSIEDQILSCERFDRLPLDENGRPDPSQADVSIPCDGYEELKDGHWVAKAMYDPLLKPGRDAVIKKFLGDRSIDATMSGIGDFFKGFTDLRYKPGVFEQGPKKTRKFTNAIRRLDLRHHYFLCANMEMDSFIEEDDKPEWCMTVRKLLEKDELIAGGGPISPLAISGGSLPTFSSSK